MKNILKNLSKKTKDSLNYYVSGLILSEGSKTCTKLALLIKKKHDFLYQFLSKRFLSEIFSNLMIALVKEIHKISPGWIIIDDTILSKFFSKLIVGVYDLYNAALKRPDRGFCIIVLCWSNGKITIPIKFKWLFSKEIIGEKYKTKSNLAEELLLFCKLKKIPFTYFTADGHYSTVNFLPFLMQQKIKFVMKISRNRKIKTSNGIYEQLQKHPALKLLRNSRCAKVKALYHGEQYFFSSQKRQRRDGSYETIYLISNMDIRAKKYLKFYDGRWEIEEMFRTLKQSLGLNDCQARDIDKQKVHIYASFFAYTFLSTEKNRLNLENPEEAKMKLLQLKLNKAMCRMSSFSENFQCCA